jgi:hypothetical protein
MNMKKYTLSLLLLLPIVNVAMAQYDEMAAIPGGKMYFSDKPFTNSNAGSKTSFKSNEFIYGRIELDKSMKDAFNMSALKSKPTYVSVFYQISRNGQNEYLQVPTYIKVDNGDENKTALNFDILPSAADAKTIMSIVDDFDAGVVAGCLYPLNKYFFRENASYKVRISIYAKTYDGWGTLEDDSKWPAVYGEFNFQFDSKDVAAITQNNDAARVSVIENGLRLDKMPDYFSKPAKISDPALTEAKILAILKRDLPSVNVVRAVIPPFDGQLKDIAKNDLGLILFRYVRPYIRVIYKDKGKCYLGSITLKEDYIGGGRYGALKFNKFWGEEGLLECSWVK